MQADKSTLSEEPVQSTLTMFNDKPDSSFDPFKDDLPDYPTVELNADLAEFVQKHKDDYRIALDEIREGFKDSHWIWWIMPQEQPSSRNRFRLNLQKAKAYIQFEKEEIHLGKNYLEIMTAVHEQLFDKKKAPWMLMGGDHGDAEKLAHSLELFFAATHGSEGSLDVRIHQVCRDLLTHPELRRCKVRFAAFEEKPS
eukprot:TRINITY_DN80449_c0_g1_i1.p1 TRINITY_DN80449_c0_g1~~TRINITY_DN80449_c0_g1_i1.p1  ORF type:complete len:213 (-),score=38.81 TRINITY_DN80449_c0_g1_i1:32-622(-)